MSLTLESEQRLIKGGLVTYFTENQRGGSDSYSVHMRT
jgi:hypothetical protein